MKSHAGLCLSISPILISLLSLSCGLTAFSFEKFALFDAATWLSLVGLFVGIVAIIVCLHGSKARNELTYAVLGVILSSPLVGFAAMSRATTTSRREFEKANTLKHSMKLLHDAVQDYAKTHNGRLPDAETWFDSLRQANPALKSDALRHPLRPEITIAYNASLSGLRISEVRRDVVLFFEAQGGPNLAGGPELLPPIASTSKIDIMLLDRTIHTYWIEHQGTNPYGNKFLPVRWKP